MKARPLRIYAFDKWAIRFEKTALSAICAPENGWIKFGVTNPVSIVSR
jgi:hypothetical protein